MRRSSATAVSVASLRVLVEPVHPLRQRCRAAGQLEVAAQVTSRGASMQPAAIRATPSSPDQPHGILVQQHDGPVKPGERAGPATCSPVCDRNLALA